MVKEIVEVILFAIGKGAPETIGGWRVAYYCSMTVYRAANGQYYIWGHNPFKDDDLFGLVTEEQVARYIRTDMDWHNSGAIKHYFPEIGKELGIF